MLPEAHPESRGRHPRLEEGPGADPGGGPRGHVPP